MTEKETTQITEMRNDGLGYTTIAYKARVIQGLRPFLLQNPQSQG